MMYRLILYILILLMTTSIICQAQSVYQAEDADVIYHGIIESEHTGFTGSGYTNLDNEVGSYLEWVVSSADSGLFTGTIFYATGVVQDRKMEIQINNVVQEEISFPPTGDWTIWSTQIFDVPLDSGVNLIRLTSTTSNGSPNLDKLELTAEAGLKYYKLNLSIIGQGNILSEPADSLFEEGSIVNLTANSETGYSFIKWIGDGY